ncbi:MAG: GspH/FimT family pseudopilin [Burkholderiales bacterium]|nr:MAG: GspH/FimT family pseudopilin [Burkholderiales bacterium]
MRISARRICDALNARRFGRPRASGGFTLIEMLVVIVIAGIVISLLTISSGSNPQRELRFEAERLAQLLALAREEAQVRGIAIRFDSTERVYRFLTVQDREWQPMRDDPDLRERAWEEPTRVYVERRDGRDAVEFGRDAVEPPFTVRLARDDAEVVIAANGLGAFVVR